MKTVANFLYGKEIKRRAPVRDVPPLLYKKRRLAFCCLNLSLNACFNYIKSQINIKHLGPILQIFLCKILLKEVHGCHLIFL